MKKVSEIPKETMMRMDEIAEKFFETSNHTDQIPINEETDRKLEQLTPYHMNYACDEYGNPISWIVVIPSQKELVEKFYRKEITEREFFDLTKPAILYTGFYICSMITIPEFRGRGLATSLIKETLQYIPLTDDALFVIWPTTDDGLRSVPRLKKVLGREILIRE